MDCICPAEIYLLATRHLVCDCKILVFSLIIEVLIGIFLGLRYISKLIEVVLSITI